LFVCIVLDDRRENPIGKDDLLSKMMFGKDPKSGEGLSDDSIIRNAGYS
jgi:cytochrome P450 / NADPH-cytochrome P450 reductase